MKKDVRNEFYNVPDGFTVFYNESTGVYTLESDTETWLYSDDYREFQDELNRLVMDWR